MKNRFIVLLFGFMLILLVSCGDVEKAGEITMTRTELMNKIKGGWAGQVIGVTYGGPTEFRYLSRMIPDSVEIAWSDSAVIYFFDNFPGLFDDIYMDLTFVDVFEKEGIDAPAESHALAFANADYMLWHGNQAARYNILNGIMPPESGHWNYNMHANDIDFQIEADFAGLMAPGMVNAATHYCDVVGHIMSSGDGYYGGVYVASMYALAFVSNDINYVVKEGLKAIPTEANYYKAMQDVISFYEQYPDDWKKAWQAIEDSQWAIDLHCPDGIASPFNIDATVNSAYVLLGLLYGQGDLEKTMEVSTRAGQDSDCNPATAAGILCTMLGYDAIDEYWLRALYPIADIDFAYTTISLNDVYEMGFNQALQVIEKFGGKVDDENVTIAYEAPIAVPLEVGFPETFPHRVTQPEIPEDIFERRMALLHTITDEEAYEIAFSGNGLVVKGAIGGELPDDYVGELEVSIDGEVERVVKLPVDYRTRTAELYWNINIPMGDHKASLKWLNPVEGGGIGVRGYIEFTDRRQDIEVITK